jgi:hypothetical protein
VAHQHDVALHDRRADADGLAVVRVSDYGPALTILYLETRVSVPSYKYFITPEIPLANGLDDINIF